MSDEIQRNPLPQQIYSYMQTKETEELIKIWQRHNTEEWSNEAFEIIHDILIERLGSIPEQGVEIMEMSDNDNTNVIEDIYHDPDRLLKISIWAKVLSWILLGYAVIQALSVLIFRMSQSMGSESEFAIPRSTNIIVSANMYLTIFYGILIGCFYFVVLQGISQGLKILVDIWEKE